LRVEGKEIMELNADVLRVKAGLKADDFDFYRCYKCGKLITRIDEIRAFTAGHKATGKICSCGSPKYQPSNPKWFEYLLPKVWKFALYRIRGLA
jgi:hypothetical protein